mgnify:CR=1 FL=1
MTLSMRTLPVVSKRSASQAVSDRLLAPMAPHIAEELWSRLGHDRTLTYDDFPVADPAFHEAMTKVQVALDYRDGPEFKKFFDADYKRLGPVVKQIGRIEEPAKK